MTINEFRQLLRDNGFPGARVEFAFNERTGQQIGDPALDNPQDRTYREHVQADTLRPWTY